LHNLRGWLGGTVRCPMDAEEQAPLSPGSLRSIRGSATEELIPGPGKARARRFTARERPIRTVQ